MRQEERKEEGGETGKKIWLWLSVISKRLCLPPTKADDDHISVCWQTGIFSLFPVKSVSSHLAITSYIMMVYIMMVWMTVYFCWLNTRRFFATVCVCWELKKRSRYILFPLFTFFCIRLHPNLFSSIHHVHQAHHAHHTGVTFVNRKKDSLSPHFLTL